MINIKMIIYAFLLVLTSRAAHAGTSIAHLFNYPFKKIVDELPAIKDAGFSYIQISPPQLSRADKEWYGRYQPIDYRVIDSPLGNEDDLKELIYKAKIDGIQIIVDVVFNHMAALGENYDLTYPPKWARQKYGLSTLFTASDFHTAFCIGDYNSTYEVRNGRLCGASPDGGLPDLDSSERVIAIQKEYLQRLLALGVKGFRFDAAKHMEPFHMRALVDALPSDILVFGEIIATRSSWDRDLSPYLEGVPNLKLMDFPLQETIRSAFGFRGDLGELVNPDQQRKSLPDNKSVSFTINHDIPQNDVFSYMIMDPRDEQLAYVYLFARGGGFPHVYSDLGKSDGLKSDRWQRAHRSPLIKSLVRYHNLMEGKPATYAVGSGCLLAINRESDGLAIINKCTNAWSGKIRSAFATRNNSEFDGKYVDLLTNQTVTAENGNLAVSVSGRSALVLVRTTR